MINLFRFHLMYFIFILICYMLSKIGYGYNEKDDKVTIYNLFRLNKYHLNNFKLLLKDPQIFIVILFSIVLLRLVFYALIWVLISTILLFIFIFSVNRYLKINTKFPYKLYSGNAVTTFTLFAMVGTYALGVILIPKYLSQTTALRISGVLGVVLSLVIVNTSGFTSVLSTVTCGVIEISSINLIRQNTFIKVITNISCQICTGKRYICPKR